MTTHSALTITLNLAHAPVCNFDFSLIKEEGIVQQILKHSMLYVIAQRSVLTFDKIEANKIEGTLNFDIKITGQDEVLHCVLPVYQSIIEPDTLKELNVVIGSYDKSWNCETLPASNAHGLQIFDADKKFLIWLSPDKLIHLHQHGIIDVNITGDIRPFSTFMVHYVGKATDQDIWKRLTGHATLQEILSIENPLNYGSLPTHEIILLFFQVNNALGINIIGDDVNAFVDNLFTEKFPTGKDVLLDAEKVLIKLLDPAYNEKKFPNYPKSIDGLYKFNYNRFVYHIAEDITLKYGDRELNFGIDQSHCDLIGIKDNEEVEIFRAE